MPLTDRVALMLRWAIDEIYFTLVGARHIVAGEPEDHMLGVVGCSGCEAEEQRRAAYRGKSVREILREVWRGTQTTPEDSTPAAC